MPDGAPFPDDLTGISSADVARLSGLHVSHVAALKAGRRRANAATLAKLRLVAVRLRARQVAGPLSLVLTYRCALALCALALGLDAAVVQASDPAKRMTLNPAWCDMATARRLAQYLMNTTMGFNQADVARACGVTKQAVNQAARAIEDAREQPDFDRLARKLEAAILGIA